MREVELVIKIPEKVKQAFDNAKDEDLYGNYYDYNSIIGKAIQNGTPLPKGHGRLIDADYKVSSDGRTVNSVCGYMAPTIIEADESESEVKDDNCAGNDQNAG